MAVESLRDKGKLNAQLWEFLGESLEHLGEYDAAWAAYNRAWLLDPQAEWAEPARMRLRERLTGKTPVWIQELLAVPHVTISAAMIAKNEARTIGKAVAALSPAVDEIIVVDTGSTDDTVAIAEAMVRRCFGTSGTMTSPLPGILRWIRYRLIGFSG
ncbi:hypothetical protein GCM10025858_20830 [Alicyclobacillus sacchari]|nr:glycosyltransferase [Alicyclobacillus sacchari]GMA57580.1 hypothetical protein GCM10025858_20830 [Alicyclobacillus sacchari]